MRRSPEDQKTHDKAVKMRKKTDAELVSYVEDRVAKAKAEGYNKGLRDGAKKAAEAPVEKQEPAIDFELLLDEISRLQGIGTASVSKIRRLLVGKGLIA